MPYFVKLEELIRHIHHKPDFDMHTRHGRRSHVCGSPYVSLGSGNPDITLALYRKCQAFSRLYQKTCASSSAEY